ncbi:MAG: LysM peptidoglycan-binding domain-containing protein [Planctomycetota bacterium]
MGKVARLGVFCLMGLAIALSRLIEVELRPPPLQVRAEAAASEATGTPVAQPEPTHTAAPSAPAPQPAPDERRYTVRNGDTLGSISKKAYGTTRHWKAILEANRDVIPDAKRMREGVELRLPEVKD